MEEKKPDSIDNRVDAGQYASQASLQSGLIYGRGEYVLYSLLGLGIASMLYNKPVLEPLSNAISYMFHAPEESADAYAALGVGLAAVVSLDLAIKYFKNRNQKP